MQRHPRRGAHRRRGRPQPQRPTLPCANANCPNRNGVGSTDRRSRRRRPTVRGTIGDRSAIFRRGASPLRSAWPECATSDAWTRTALRSAWALRPAKINPMASQYTREYLAALRQGVERFDEAFDRWMETQNETDVSFLPGLVQSGGGTAERTSGRRGRGSSCESRTGDRLLHGSPGSVRAGGSDLELA